VVVVVVVVVVVMVVVVVVVVVVMVVTPVVDKRRLHRQSIRIPLLRHHLFTMSRDHLTPLKHSAPGRMVCFTWPYVMSPKHMPLMDTVLAVPGGGGRHSRHFTK
jgi:hypothetical protein